MSAGFGVAASLGIGIGDHITRGAAERGGHRRLWNPLPGRASGSSGGRWSASAAPSVPWAWSWRA